MSERLFDEVEIMVYVMSCVRHDGRYDYVVDFRLETDYQKFHAMTSAQNGEPIQDMDPGQNGEPEQGIDSAEEPSVVMRRDEDGFLGLSIPPSLIEFCNVPSRSSGRPFREGAYYRLNLEALNMASVQRVGLDSDLFLARYDFGELQRSVEGDEDLPLLPKDKHYWLLSRDLRGFRHWPQGILMSDMDAAMLRVCVRDVGQGNWNEVLEGDVCRVVYDMGTDLRSSSDARKELVRDRFARYRESKPILLISHWDADHINCLSVITVEGLKECFSSVYCMNHFKSMLSKQIYLNLYAALEKRVFCYDPIDRKAPLTDRKVRLNNCLNFYIGQKYGNINYSGMCLYAKGVSGSANFTGDIRLEQARAIYREERRGGERHLLVAPHHGGRYATGRKEYDERIHTVAISVGVGNSYGHPHEKMLELYREMATGKLHRTSISKELIFDCGETA